MNWIDLPSYCATIVVVNHLNVPGAGGGGAAAAAAGGGGGAAAAGGGVQPAATGGGGGGGAAAAAAGGGVQPAATGGGVQPAAQAGPTLLQAVLSLDAQRAIHNMLEAAGGVFSSWSGFTRIHPGTFLAQQGTGMVVISAQGYLETARFFDPQQWAVQMDLNLQWMAMCIRAWFFGNKRPVPEIEVELGLLHMMENEGHRMWDAIRDHSSLVPLVNRPDLLLRLHDHLVNVVLCTDLNGYWAVLGMLQGSVHWHASVNNNLYLAAFYGGSFYNNRDPTPQVQAFQLLRYHRNPIAHGLEHAVPPGPADPTTVPAAPLPAAAMPRGFQPRIPAQKGDTPARPSFARWQITLMFYSEWPLFIHRLQRAMHIIGQLRVLAIQFLFMYPRR